MSDDDNPNYEMLFTIEIAKQGRAFCKKCKRKCQEGELRIAKLTPNPLGTGRIKTWHHINCIFEVFLKQRQTTKRIEGPHDVEGWELLSNDAKTDILKKIEECNKAFEAMHKSAKKTKNSRRKSQHNDTSARDDALSVSSPSTESFSKHGAVVDNSFREFRNIVAKVSNAKTSQEKINIFHTMFHKGSDGISFKGDLMLWCKLLLPTANKRFYNIEQEQLVKIFSRIFGVSSDTIKESLKKYELAQVIKNCFEKNKYCKPAHSSNLTLTDVDEFLDVLSKLSDDGDRFNHFSAFVEKCTSNDLKVIIRLIFHDLLMKAGAKHVFEAVHPKAYRKFQSCHNVKTTIITYLGDGGKKDKHATRGSPKSLKMKIEDAIDFEKTEPVDVHESTARSEGRTSIPNYFKNVKLYLEEGVSEKYTEWVRYFCAYGGTVLSCSERGEATHVLHLKDTISQPTIECASSCRHLIVEWIKDTIKKECLQDFRPYSVRWKPSFHE